MGRRRTDDDLDVTTRPVADSDEARRASRAATLTILHHPDPRRVGERAVLGGKRESPIVLGRSSPPFGAPGEAAADPLADPHVSRRGIELVPHRNGSVTITVDPRASELECDGERVLGPRRVPSPDLERGVVLELGHSVVLLLHLMRTPAPRLEDLGLVGQSEALYRLVRSIRQVAPLPVPVLLRGESGTGKELVARAIHAESGRAKRPFVSINTAAIPPSMVAAALFGHARGAFTGATESAAGYFRAAEGGTILLDEIGAVPLDVQAALLRTLDSGEVQPVGEAPRRVDVRIIAATDASLERAVEQGDFRLPLLQRLASYELRIAPLSARRDDIGRLLVHFLGVELAAIGASARLSAPPPGARPWLPAWLVAAAAQYPWPGNVRELRNLARALAIEHADAPEVRAGPATERLTRPTDRAPPDAAASARPRRRLDEIDEDEVRAALVRHDYRPGPAAAQLGVARSSLYQLIERSDGLRKAADLSATEIDAALGACADEVARAAAALGVSERALRLRLRALRRP